VAFNAAAIGDAEALVRHVAADLGAGFDGEVAGLDAPSTVPERALDRRRCCRELRCFRPGSGCAADVAIDPASMCRSHRRFDIAGDDDVAPITDIWFFSILFSMFSIVSAFPV
jgi:hypothetical protein